MSDKANETDVKSIVERYRAAEEALKRVTAEDLLPALADVLARNPLVKCLIWTQYTPYFNDGDPCRFGVHVETSSARSRMPRPGELDGWDVEAGEAPEGDPAPYAVDDEDEEFLSDYDYPDPLFAWRSKDEEARRQASAVVEFLEGLPRDLLERALGDGVKVFAWAGGLLTTEYSYD